MITLTLLNMDVTIGNRPTWDTFDHTFKHKIKPNLYFTRASFSSSIEDRHEEHDKVSEFEYITFITLWLSHFFFFSSSL